MKQKRLFEKTLAILVAMVMVLTSLSTSAVSAADQPQPNTGNPVSVDEPVVPPSQKIAPRDLKKIDPGKDVRVIVQLKQPALARYSGGINGLAATANKATGARKLNANSSASRSYTSYLAQQQGQFKSELVKKVPAARVDQQFSVLVNAMAVKVKGSDINALLAMPEVQRVSFEREYKLEMDASLSLIGLGSGTLGGAWTDSGLWAAVGGHQNAGKGIRIADIDSGITPENACFSGAGYTYPAGFPRGEKSLTNGKIIAAYSYFRPDDPPVYPPTARDDPASAEGGHGTHTAGTMVCNYGTSSLNSAIKISGVAPKAQLMVYRVFYESMSGSHSAYTTELLAAIEQAVKDGADVVNNSWGGTSLALNDNDLESQAYGAAVDSGVVVTFSAGNSGNNGVGDEMTIGNPGTGAKFITVAASSTGRIYATTLDVVGADVPPDLVGIEGASINPADLTAPAVDLQVEGYDDSIACFDAIPPEIAAGKIVVVRRGVCALVDKVANAKAGGAVGVVIRNVAGGATSLPVIKPVLPTIHISAEDGDALYNWMAAHSDTVLTIKGPAQFKNDPSAEDILAYFSSRGPNPDLTIKPDITAPGMNILSSVSPAEIGGTPDFDFYQGTSMAAPHVTGAAALMVQAHPTWTPAQIKSALMSTAAEPDSLGGNPLERGAGRLNLNAPNKVAAVFDQPSLSYQLVTAGLGYRFKSLTLTNVTGAPVTYAITTEATDGSSLAPQVTNAVPLVIDTVTVPASGSATVQVALTTPTPGDMYGRIVFTDTAAASPSPTLHVPYFARVVAPLADADILLVDNDLSPADPGPDDCPDAQPAITAAIQSLGKTVTVWDVAANNSAIPLNQMHKYPTVIWSGGQCGDGPSFAANEVRGYLAAGGRMLMTGQDILYYDNNYYASYEASFDPALLFGVQYVQDTLYSFNKPEPAMTGDKTPGAYMRGTVVGLDYNSQIWVDEMNTVPYDDMDTQAILTSVPTPFSLGQGVLGVTRSSEPTLERVQRKAPWTKLGYRSAYLSFGLEGVVEQEGLTSASALLDSILSWMDDEPTVMFDQETYYATPGIAAKFSASPDVSILIVNQTGYANQSLGLRWDFGDGTPIQATTGVETTHKYAKLGTYKAYVEFTDGFGHKAVAGPVEVKVVKTPPAPYVLAPTGLATHTPNLRWYKVRNATSYMVEVYSVAQAQTVLSQRVDASDCGATTCVLKSSYLAKGGYKLKVRAAIGTVLGPFSPYRSFTVTAR